LYARIRLSNIPLLWSGENSVEAADYKHFVPLGLVVMVRTFEKQDFEIVSQRVKHGSD
jgi:hypothetical protein